MIDQYSTAHVADTAVDNRSVYLYLFDQLFAIQGMWQWEMNCNDVYCSEVMYFPKDFTGTKGIVHPDDLPTLRPYIEAIAPGGTALLNFRIITTYGEVVTITGDNVVLTPIKDEDAFSFTPDQVIAEVKKETEQARELNHLHYHKEWVTMFEKLNSAGCWYFNISTGETYYTDQAFRLYGLLPQSLNAQLHTFAGFIHPHDKDVVLNAIDTAIRRLAPLDIQYRILTVDDEERVLQLTTTIHHNRLGETIMYGMLKNITPLRQVETQLETAVEDVQFQNSLLRFTEQTEDIALWQIDLLTRKLSYSDNYLKLFGIKPTQGAAISFLNFIQYIHPDDQEAVKQVHSEIIQQHIAPDIEFKVIRPDGKIRVLRQRGKLVPYGRTNLLMVGTLKDISHQKAMKEKLHYFTNEGYIKDLSYQQAEEMAGMAGFYMNIETRRVNWGANIYNLLGVKTVADLNLPTFLRYIHSEDKTAFTLLMEEVEKTGEPAELMMRLAARGDTRFIKARFRLAEYDEGKVLICILADVTDYEKLQQKLNERISFIELLSDSLENKIMVTDINHSIIEWNRACELGFKKKKEDVIFKNYFEVFPELKDHEIFEGIRHALAGKHTTFTHTSSVYLKGYHNLRLSPLHNAEGKVMGVMHLIQDVTRETELQNSLNEKLYFIESLVEVSVDPIIVLDKNLNYIYWNRKSEEMFSINKEYAIGKNILELVPDTKNNPSHVQFRQALSGKTVFIPPSENEEDIYREVYLVPIKDEKENVSGILWMLHDLSTTRPNLVNRENEKEQ